MMQKKKHCLHFTDEGTGLDMFKTLLRITWAVRCGTMAGFKVPNGSTVHSEPSHLSSIRKLHSSVTHPAGLLLPVRC